MSSEPAENRAFIPGAKKKPQGGFKLFLHNPEEKTYCGRTCGSWLGITVFYLIFYSCLAGFFAICLAVFMQTIGDDKPVWFGKGSILGSNPGMGYQPWLRSNPESTLIHFDRGNPASKKDFIERMAAFYEAYENPKEKPADCDDFVNSAEEGDEKDKSCKYDFYDLLWSDPDRTVRPGTTSHFCHPMNNFGFGLNTTGEFTPPSSDNAPDLSYYHATGGICVALTLNKLLDFKPTSYSAGSVPDILTKERYHMVGTKVKLYDAAEGWTNDRVIVHCKGENPADVDHLGRVVYTPPDGFPGKAYPYVNKKSYQSPFVVVYFPDVHIGSLVMVECSAYALNIDRDSTLKLGMVHFEILLDEKPFYVNQDDYKKPIMVPETDLTEAFKNELVESGGFENLPVTLNPAPED